MPSTLAGGGDWHLLGQVSNVVSLHEDHGEKAPQCTMAQSVSLGTWLQFSGTERMGRADFLLLSPKLNQWPSSHQTPGSMSWSISPGLMLGQVLLPCGHGTIVPVIERALCSGMKRSLD